jgi:hypothetical protein
VEPRCYAFQGRHYEIVFGSSTLFIRVFKQRIRSSFGILKGAAFEWNIAGTIRNEPAFSTESPNSKVIAKPPGNKESIVQTESSSRNQNRRNENKLINTFSQSGVAFGGRESKATSNNPHSPELDEELLESLATPRFGG